MKQLNKELVMNKIISKVDELSILSKCKCDENNTSNLVEICVQAGDESVQDLNRRKWDNF
jgi:hypothetical protein